jgi:hypothetical protein
VSVYVAFALLPTATEAWRLRAPGLALLPPAVTALCAAFARAAVLQAAHSGVCVGAAQLREVVPDPGIPEPNATPRRGDCMRRRKRSRPAPGGPPRLGLACMPHFSSSRAAASAFTSSRPRSPGSR